MPNGVLYTTLRHDIVGGRAGGRVIFYLSYAEFYVWPRITYTKGNLSYTDCSLGGTT